LNESKSLSAIYNLFILVISAIFAMNGNYFTEHYELNNKHLKIHFLLWNEQLESKNPILPMPFRLQTLTVEPGNPK
jgi:hypothetical protein